MRADKLLLLGIFLCVVMSGCTRSRSEFCDDANSAGRYLTHGAQYLGGKQGNSRETVSRDEFMCQANDFIPLEEEKYVGGITVNSTVIQQAQESPGDPGSSVPGIDGFRDPRGIPELAEVFKQIHFPYNSDLIKGQENLQIVRGVAGYMKKNKDTYIFVEGHCDERGAEAYNLALGARRSNTVRSLLLAEGVDPNKVFTISYGKEKPLVLGHNEEAWKLNRRAEFKIYQR